MAVIKVNNPKNIIDVVNKKAYFKLVNVGGLKGDKGDKGDTGTIMVGTTTTGQPGTNASVENVGTNTAAVLNFTIPRGDKGAKGDTGATGSAATVNVGSTSTGAPGTSASVTNSGTSSAAVLNFTIPRGAKGDTGTAATVAAGTTTTLPAGSSATVTNSGTSSAAVFNFGVPKGDKGDTGTAATVAVGSTTTGAAGTSASVTNSGTSSAAVLDFTIPKGDTGQVSSNYVNSLPSSGNEYSFYLVDRDIPEQTATGEYINFTNANNYGNLTSLELDGNATQNGTPTPSAPVAVNTTTGEQVVKVEGKNLAYDGWAQDFVGRINNAEYASIADYDGRNCLMFLPRAGYGDYDNKYIFKTNFAENTQYTFSFDEYTTDQFTSLAVVYTDGMAEVLFYETAGYNKWVHVVKTTAQNKTVKYLRGCWQGATKYIDFNTFQVELGSTATTYEPYQGQDYEVDLSSKNLFDKNSATTGKILDRTTGTLENNASYDTSDFMPVKAGEKYTYTGFNVWYASYFDANKSFVSTPNNSTTITIPSGVAYLRCSLLQTNLDTAQFEHGTQATTYAEFYNYELAKIGTYRDRIYKNDGKWYVEKQTGKVVLNGSEGDWSFQSSNAPFRYRLTGAYATYDDASTYISDYFQSVAWNATWTDYNYLISLNSGNSILAFRYTGISTLDDFKTWLSTHPTTVYYALATPTTSEITNSALVAQLDAILSAYLYQGVNNIFTDTVNEMPTIKIAYLTYDQYNKCHVYIWNDTLGDWQVIVP